MADTMRGTVKWFNDAKGFGFIQHETGKDVFVHYSVIETEGFKTLKDGEEVTYELREGDKGLNASRVVRTNPPPAKEKRPALQKGVASLIEIERTPLAKEEMPAGILGRNLEEELGDSE